MCPNGTYLHLYLGQCLTCKYPCESCSSAVQCTSCADGYLHSADLNKCYLTTCPSGMFLDNSTSSCLKCHSSCAVCLDNTSDCVQCSVGYYSQPNTTSSSLLSCLISCPQQYYPESTMLKCLPCQPPCLTCTSLRSCLSCVESTPLLIQMQCVSVD
jgi:proprotein convertase subtilisin/kexin type 5